MTAAESSRTSGVFTPVLAFLAGTALLIPVFSSSYALPFLWGLLTLGAAVWIVSRPHWGVMVVILTSGFSLTSIFADARFLSVPYLVGGLLLIPFLLGILREGDARVLRVPQVQILAAIGVLYLVSTGWNSVSHPRILLPELDKTEWMLVALLARFAFLVCFVSFIVTEPQIELAWWLMILIIVASAFDSLESVTGVNALGRAEGDFGYATNSNRLAFMCMFGTALLWFRAQSAESRALRTVAKVLCLVLPGVALASGSRNGLIEILVFGAIVVVDSFRQSGARGVRSLLFVFAGALLLLSLVPGHFLERATNFDPRAAGHGLGQESLQNRIIQLGAAVRLFVAHPLLGVGIGNFETLAPAPFAMGAGVHNAYLRALAEGGILTLALYLLLFAVNFRMLAQLERLGPPTLRWLAKGLRSGLILYMVYSLTADAWLSDYLYLIVGLTIAAASVPRPSPARVVSVHPSEASMRTVVP